MPDHQHGILIRTSVFADALARREDRGGEHRATRAGFADRLTADRHEIATAAQNFRPTTACDGACS